MDRQYTQWGGPGGRYPYIKEEPDYSKMGYEDTPGGGFGGGFGGGGFAIKREPGIDDPQTGYPYIKQEPGMYIKQEPGIKQEFVEPKLEPLDERRGLKRQAQSPYETPQPKRYRPETDQIHIEDEPDYDRTAVLLDWYNSDLSLIINSEHFLSAEPLTSQGFCYVWHGVRATYGYLRGRVCFEVKVEEHIEVPQLEDEQHPHVLRVGWSIDDAGLTLGEDPYSYGYGGTAKASTALKFKDYGVPYKKGDVIGCFLDMDSEPIVMSFSVNGRNQGMCYEVSHRTLQGKALFPHILTKNCSFKVNFGTEYPWFPPLTRYTYVGNIPLKERVLGSQGPETRADSEVIMMVGLPACGKTTWVENYCKQNPDKKYYVLGTNFLIDKMKVNGLKRKRFYHGRWEVLIERCTKCLNKLLEMSYKRRRNFIVDQTNVYPTARRRKMKGFPGFYRRAMVIVPNDDEFKERTEKQIRQEGKAVPDSAVLEMKVNFTLPEVEDDLFDSVEFAELDREESQKLIDQYVMEAQAAGYKKKPTGNRGGFRGGWNRDRRGGSQDNRGRGGSHDNRGRGGSQDRGRGGYNNRGGYNRDSFGGNNRDGQSRDSSVDRGNRDSSRGNDSNRGGFGRDSTGGDSNRGGYGRGSDSNRGGFGRGSDSNRRSFGQGSDSSREGFGRGSFDNSRDGSRGFNTDRQSSDYGRSSNSSFGGNDRRESFGGNDRRESFGGNDRRESFGGNDRRESFGGNDRRESFGGNDRRESFGGNDKRESFGGNDRRDSFGGSDRRESFGGNDRRDSFGGNAERSSRDFNRSDDSSRGGFGQDNFGGSMRDLPNMPKGGGFQNDRRLGSGNRDMPRGYDGNRGGFGQDNFGGNRDMQRGLGMDRDNRDSDNKRGGYNRDAYSGGGDRDTDKGFGMDNRDSSSGGGFSRDMQRGMDREYNRGGSDSWGGGNRSFSKDRERDSRSDVDSLGSYGRDNSRDMQRGYGSSDSPRNMGSTRSLGSQDQAESSGYSSLSSSTSSIPSAQSYGNSWNSRQYGGGNQQQYWGQSDGGYGSQSSQQSYGGRSSDRSSSPGGGGGSGDNRGGGGSWAQQGSGGNWGGSGTGNQWDYGSNYRG